MTATDLTSPDADSGDEDLGRALRSAYSNPPGGHDASAARRRLIAAADADGLLDITYRTIESVLGTLLLASTDIGLMRVAFDCEDHDQVLGALADTVSPRILRSDHRLDDAARQIDDYLSGTRRDFRLDLDLRLAQGFRRTVLDHLPEVAYGTTASYATLADLSGNPRAVRAAASACSHNPLPLVLPCHRIVKSDGSIGKYLAGVDAKRTLLDLEAAA